MTVHDIDVQPLGSRAPGAFCLFGKPTRIGMRALADGKKVRMARKSGEIIDKG